MPARRKPFSKTGSEWSLFFILILNSLLIQSLSGASADKAPQFREFNSSCIDLGSYNARTKELTVRFVSRRTQRFYRYSNVPPGIWRDLVLRDKTGGVGNYLHTEILRYPTRFPAKEVRMDRFIIFSKKKSRKLNGAPAY